MDRRGFLSKALGLGAVLAGVKALPARATGHSSRWPALRNEMFQNYTGTATFQVKKLPLLVKVPCEMLVPRPPSDRFPSGSYVTDCPLEFDAVGFNFSHNA